MSTKISLAFGLLAFAPGASAAPAPAPPARVQITLSVIQVPDSVRVELGPETAAADIYRDLMLRGSGEAAQISLVTPADFPGVADYSRTFVFTTVEQGKPQKNFYTAPTRLEATPHVNADGTITVRVRTQVTLILPTDPATRTGSAPLTQNRGLTSTRTFRSGPMIVFGDVVRNTLDHKAGGPDDGKQIIQFLSVGFLTAAAPEGARTFPGGPPAR